jgi:hypothetical protein
MERENLHYINNFENNFVKWVEGLSGIVAAGGEVQDMRPAVQTLVNAYHEEKGGLGPVEAPNFNTLHLFISISGASKDHSGENESLKILEQGFRRAREYKDNHK